jgi:hypothetical protein
MIRKVLMMCAVLVLVGAIVAVSGCTNSLSSSSGSPTPAVSSQSPTAASPSPKASQTEASPSAQATALPTTPPANIQSYTGPFVGSKNSNVYHYPWCYEAAKIKPENLVVFATVADACAAGYRPCEVCDPPSCGPTPSPTPTPTPKPTPGRLSVSFDGASEITHGAVFELSAIVMQGNTPVTTGTVTFSLAGQTYTAAQTDSSGIAGRWTSPQFSPITQVGPYTATASYTGPAGTAQTTLQITVT